MLLSILRAFIRCGALLARSVDLRDRAPRDPAFWGMTSMKPSGQAYRRPIWPQVGRDALRHFFFGFSLSADSEILSFRSVQVLRASATTSEQVSICSNTRLAS